ncbi:MAG: hypothetical protein GY870_05150, partial [archaeon]|nr:hypothetical protein [archaeon]
KPKLKRLQEKRIFVNEKTKLEKEKLWVNRAQLEREIKHLTTEIKNADEKQEDFQKDRENIEITINQLIENIIKHEEEYKENIKQILEKKAEDKSLSEKINEWQMGKDNLANDIIRTKSKIKSYEVELKSKSKENVLLQEEIEKYRFELGVVNTQRQNLMNQFKIHEKSRKTHQKLMEEFDELKKKEAEINLEIEKNQININSIEKQIENQMDDIKQLRQELDKYKWYTDDPKKYSKESLTKQRDKIKLALEKLNGRINACEDENKFYEKQLETLKTSVLMKELPKPRELKNLIKEIKSRNLDVIGPIIDEIEFNPKIGAAVDSILNKFVLNSFIVKNKGDFLLVHDLIKKSGAKCNVYQTLEKNVIPNESITVDKEQGIYGYLSDYIKPLSNRDIINKLILSICRNTIIVKDKSVGYDVIKQYKHRGRVVTLDGTVIRTYKYVMESRASEGKRNYRSPIDQKRKLSELQEKINETRDSLETYQNKKIKFQRAYDQILSRFNNIQAITFNYRKITIAINKKAALFTSKKKFVENKNLQNLSLSEIEELRENLRKDLPKNFEELNEFFEVFQDKFSDIEEKAEKLNKYLTVKTKEQTNIEHRIERLKENLTDNETHLEEMENTLKENDSKILTIISHISELKEEIDSLGIRQQVLEEETKSIKTTKMSEEKNLNECKDKISRIKIKIENIYAQIYQKETLFKEIKVDIEELGEKYIERSIQEVENDLNVIYEKLRKYYDVSEDIIDRKKELEEKIQKILEKKEHLFEEIDEAQKAEMSLENELFSKFKANLRYIEKDINKRFANVGINRKGKLKMIGELGNLGVEIYVSFQDGIERKLTTLSGGEQTMFAISLMLTLQDLHPSPMCIFDEAQMFLDKENSHEVSKLIKGVTEKGIQFIMILPDASKTILNLANSVVGIAKNGKEEVSTVIEIPFWSN